MLLKIIYQCSFLADIYSTFLRVKFILLNIMTLNLVLFSSIIIHLQSKAPKCYNLNCFIKLHDSKNSTLSKTCVRPHARTHLSACTQRQLFVVLIIFIAISCFWKANKFWYQKQILDYTVHFTTKQLWKKDRPLKTNHN